MVAPPSYVAHGELLRSLDTECALAQPKRNGRADWLAIVRLIEWPELRDRVGHSGCAEVLEAVAGLIEADIPLGDRVLHTDAGEIVVHSTEEPVKGKVNKEVLKELTKLFHAKVELASGATSREKQFIVKGFTQLQVQQLLNPP